MGTTNNRTSGLTDPGRSEAEAAFPNWVPTRRAFLGAAAGVLASFAGSTVHAQTAANTGRLINPDFASAGDAARMIRERAISSRELTARMLDRIARFNPQLNAVVNVLGDQALADARRADDAQARGVRLGMKARGAAGFDVDNVDDVIHGRLRLGIRRSPSGSGPRSTSRGFASRVS